MACEGYQAAIAERLDGPLDATREAALERHLNTCADCSALARDLEQIRLGLSTLETLQPPLAVWTRVKAGVETARAPGIRTALRRRLLALAASVVIVVGLGAFYLTRPNPGTSAPSSPTASTVTAPAEASRTEDAASLVQSIEEELRLAEQHYERAITGLEQAATADQTALEPQLAATLQKNLGVIDQAIAESRSALRAQPSSQPARESLFDAFKNKVTLLQDTISLINEMRKGDDAGTARVMGELAK